MHEINQLFHHIHKLDCVRSQESLESPKTYESFGMNYTTYQNMYAHTWLKLRGSSSQNPNGQSLWLFPVWTSLWAPLAPSPSVETSLWPPLALSLSPGLRQLGPNCIPA